MNINRLERLGAMFSNGISLMSFDETFESSKTLGKIETLQITGRRLNDLFLQFSPNLKHLLIECDYTPLDQWLFKLNKCSNLGYIELTGIATKIIGMERFFDTLPNLQTLEINWRCVLENIEAFMCCNVKLNKLIVDICDDDDAGDIRLICPQLNQLNDCGFYKRLHLSQEDLVEMVSPRGFDALNIRIGCNW